MYAIVIRKKTGCQRKTKFMPARDVRAAIQALLAKGIKHRTPDSRMFVVEATMAPGKARTKRSCRAEQWMSRGQQAMEERTKARYGSMVSPEWPHNEQATQPQLL